MSVMEALKKIGAKAGVTDEEMAELLADEELEHQHPEVDFNDLIPGEAADVLEVFLADAGEPVEDSNGWLWAPMIRAGQHAMRPGPKGQKVRRPLKVIEGKSKDPLQEIGLQDLVDAFKSDAVDYVTVPTSHDNGVLENTGFIEDMKILPAKINSGPNKGTKVPTLFGGYNFTEPDVKARVKRGTIPGRSCGILYNYVNTETGAEFASVVEHVALTAKPWIRGMARFGRKLSEDKEPVPLRLSDEEPESQLDEGDEIEALLANSSGGSATVTWNHEDSPNWMRQQVDEILRQARMDKQKARRGNGAFIEEPLPYYRCVEAKPNSALISDGYGDGSNFWVANFTIADGTLALEDFSSWSAVKSVYVADTRDPPPKKNEPLKEAETDNSPRAKLAEAQKRRRHKLSGDKPEVHNTTHPRGGEKMADGIKETSSLQLSEEAQARIEAAEARAEALEKHNQELTEQVSGLVDNSKRTDVANFLDELKEMGLDEKHGFSGALVEIENILMADDLGPAVTSEKFSEDGEKEVALTLTSAFKRVFGAIKKGEDGKIALGEQLEQPSGTEGDEETKAGEEKPDGGDGKPKADAGEEELSVEKASERAEKLISDNPELGKLTGLSAGEPDEKKEDQ